jgi:glutathione S-transferase
MNTVVTLISHPLCPYVQRVAIVLQEKGVAFTRQTIDLADKPEWFVRISPLGKTPVLIVDEVVLFESAAICEFLEDVYRPHLHPQAPLLRAQHRAWMEFASVLLSLIGGLYNAPDDAALLVKAGEINLRLQQLELAVAGDGYFAGAQFTLVDAVFAPLFRYFEVFVGLDDCAFFHALPKVQQWRQLLAQRASVQQAVACDYPQQLRTFLLARDTALARRMRAVAG